ncbi:fumarylacetoacetate hydrolase domain-containing protein 2A-like isoform X1 [Spodoptera litura]|uniref:Fumarylacetoacetate hydrolase domain-containing protein 2A-like isoform X1 n=2 Tax=Spodoptera litura TaxID=69820 RepID=A0A9J7ITI8_SPOLT|nr:fumarylacetoacetate hydrolase domain-containing protein 2A-like isoform X1 [Spodoptera litura]
MKFVQFIFGDCPNQIRVGYLRGLGVVELSCTDCAMPRTMLELLQADIAHKISQVQVNNPTVIPLNRVILIAPITGVDKVLGVAYNYSDQCQELGVEESRIPCVFSKFPSTIIGPNQAVRIRPVCEQVGWQLDLAVVIGKKACSVKADNAHKYIFGYTVAQDITEKEWLLNQNGTQYLLGKSQDTFCPLGPYIMTSDEAGQVENLAMVCSVNGEVKQRGNTSQMIHKIPALIERITTVMTLYPGDIILTGTPAGIGGVRNPPEFLKPGDVIRSEIENIGVLTTKVVEF